MAERILVLDGAMGTMLQQADLTADDFGGPDLEGCNENLVLTRPDVIQGIHEAYFAAGADMVETNTFGSASIVLAEYDIADRSYDISRRAAELARAAADKYATDDRPRFVAGAMGPTTKALTVTGGTTFDALVETYTTQARGLIDGGADVLLLETTQDTLNLKAATLGIEAASEACGRRLPLMLSATIEPMGSMLAGQTIDAFYTSIEHLKPLSVGMNCATGPEFMTDHLRTLSEIATCFVSVYPNAGLPDEEGVYPETPESLAKQIGRFAEHGWVDLVGGCCGTTPAHIAAIARAVAGKKPREPVTTPVAAVSNIERVAIDKENRPILVGERTNVIGSAKFKRLIEAEEWEKASEVGRAQVKKGAQIMDVCLSHTDRDEPADIDRFYPELSKKVKAPLMIDSTDADAIERALRHTQGKAIINSINLEDGEERFEAVCPLVKRYGGALIVGCIDETGMAVTRERKLEVAERSFRLLTEKYGIPPQDIIFDPLVFPCGTGDEAYVGSALETREATRLITENLPDCHTVLGISNVSFGLPDAGREVLNSVFLYDCVQAGLTMAIVNTEGIERYPEIPQDERDLCRALLYTEGDDPLTPFVEHFRGKKKRKERPKDRAKTPEERVARCVVEGTKEGLTEDLDLMLKKMPDPLDIINGPLMEGMAEVGRLFAKNELIVAEVLQSAEAMKAAVTHLEPHMEQQKSRSKGKILIATVKGDVHDIGKNLVEIILANNGYEVIDLGIKTRPETLIQAYREHKPDYIGLSGLLVKSAQQMVVTAEDLKEAGIDCPLLVGGAALSAKFTANKITPSYGAPRVVYAKDAMQGLDICDRIRNDPEAFFEETTAAYGKLSSGADVAPTPSATDGQVVPLEPAPITQVPDLERHTERAPDLDTLWSWVNPRMLMGKHLGLKGDPEKLIAQGDEKAIKLHEELERLKEEIREKDLIKPKAVWRYFPAASDGDDLIIYDPDDPARVLETFHFRRQTKSPGRCLSDYTAPIEAPPDENGIRDTVALFAVTAGEGIRAQAQKWKEEGEYLKSHALQALALETAEAYAEALHERLRDGWGIRDEGLTRKEVFQAKYRGIRVSFGYPACPDLEDQEKLWRLLRPGEIGIELTDGYMMDPEASVSALVFHHPEGRYFNV
ncbi:MAG: methionine synthase [Euryarchaeota archaeon]|nr:methionine synthase [Euryarchaeota archaeon]